MIPNTPNKYFKIKWASYGGGIKPSNINLTSTPGVYYIFIYFLGNFYLYWRFRSIYYLS